MIPFPSVTDLAFRLQPISVHASTWLLDIAGLPVISSGAEIHLNDTVFTVGIVCSGIDTLVALVALAAVYAHILTGNIFRRISLVALAFPVAVAGNILRITSIILIAHFFNLKTATGWYHNLSSPVFFAVEFVVLVLVARAARCRINYGLFSR
jgi:exosortase